MVRYTQYKRKRQSTGRYPSKRARTRWSQSASSGRRRRRINYRKRKSYRSRPRSSGSKFWLTKMHQRNALNMKSLTNLTHIPYSVRQNSMQKFMYRTLGDAHYYRWEATGSSSTVLGNNPLVYRFMPSLDNSTTYSWISGWNQNPPLSGEVCPLGSQWASNSYTVANYPTQFKRILWSHSFIRIVMNNVNENCRVRVQFVKKAKDLSQSASALADYNYDPNVPQPQQYWKVLYSKTINLDGPTNDTNVQIRESNYFFPWNRVIQTYNNTSATGISSWTGQSNANDYLFMVISTDDASSTDTEYVNFKVFVEHKFYECA